MRYVAEEELEYQNLEGNRPIYDERDVDSSGLPFLKKKKRRNRKNHQDHDCRLTKDKIWTHWNPTLFSVGYFSLAWIGIEHSSPVSREITYLSFTLTWIACIRRKKGDLVCCLCEIRLLLKGFSFDQSGWLNRR